MESGKYPRLRFQLTGVTPTVRSADSMDVTLMGEFAIHGETRPVSLPARVVFSGSTVRVASTFPLNLKDYRIGGLTKMLGLLKMDPGILVHVDLTFQLATP
jgi:polyisoprenoid-binding protein YceI